MKSYQDQIDEIMDFFEFSKIIEMMKATNWTYGEDELPDEYRLRKTARSVLKRVCDGESKGCGTGGFMAYNDDGFLTLHWGLDTSGLFDFDND